MRDILTTAIFVYFIIQVPKKPYIGLLLMAWLTYMSPHRLGWGFAYNLPFYQAATIFTLACTLHHWSTGKLKPTPIGPVTVVLIIFILWTGITTIAAEYTDFAWISFKKFLKIQVGIFLTLVLIDNKEKLLKLVAVIALSIGFYGIKGGIFSIQNAGNYRVWGPSGSFIQGNNELALALLMILPFIYLIYTQANKPWIKWSTTIAFLLILASVLFSYSRGAFLAMATSMCFFWLHTNKKLPLALLFVLFISVSIPFIPQAWYERMNTIETYDEDESALGRINAWQMAFNVAKDRVTGGGYEQWSRPMFTIYAPDPTDVKDAHSIYFEVLGEHGFPGLGLFLLFYFLAWREGSKAAARAAGHIELEWARTLVYMSKASLVAYASGGAFLGLAFYDLPYHVVTIVLITSHLVNQQQRPAQNASMNTHYHIEKHK
ncbi:MAG: putative O-glycosylation ligase, exosortase A system-associated [Motiliproteus sp.]